MSHHVGSTSPTELDAAISALARTPRLLVGCDYDGTLAPIVADPATAHPMTEAIAVLRTLTALPNTWVAVVSGRSLRDLAALTRLPSEVHLVGSHGTEFDLGFVHRLTPDQSRALHHIRSLLSELAARVEGADLELKPASVALHVRKAKPKAGAALIKEVEQVATGLPDVHIKHGKKVIELAVVPGDKGAAINELRHSFAPTATLFVGDDVGDEAVFRELSSCDMSIKVGTGRTAAQFRVAGPEQVVLTLARLQEERHFWFTGGNAEPIEDHSLLSDQSALALVSPNASVNWLCNPSPEGPGLFASLLGDEAAGHFSIRPEHGRAPISQAYLPGTMTLRTRFAGVDVVDYLAPAAVSDAQRASSSLFRVVTASVPTDVVFAPRPDFGQVQLSLEQTELGLVGRGGSAPFALRAPGVTWELRQERWWSDAVAHLPGDGSTTVFELRLGTWDLTEPGLPEPVAREECARPWAEWLNGLALPVTERDDVARSALTLRALVNRPTGGILAAPTLGLPEWIGGIRNWDYRYVWVRDSAVIAQALLALGSTEETDMLIAWMAARFQSGSGPDHVRPLYAITGEHSPVEAELTGLPGYAGSRPVLVGNAAAGQAQLDVFGAVARLVWERAKVRGKPTEVERALLSDAVDAVSHRWQEPDHGIWEIRDTPRHHTHSKMMSWVAVDSAISAFELDGTAVPAWHELRDEIAADVLANGWHERMQTFVSAYDRHEIDAAVLQPIGYGFPATQEQVAGTVRAVEGVLRRGYCVYRYRFDDGITGDEGAVHICAAWLIEAYLAAGQLEDAQHLMAAMVSSTGHTGLLPEMVDPLTGRGLGNHPQGYSHAGLIKAALALDAALRAG